MIFSTTAYIPSPPQSKGKFSLLEKHTPPVFHIPPQTIVIRLLTPFTIVHSTHTDNSSIPTPQVSKFSQRICKTDKREQNFYLILPLVQGFSSQKLYSPINLLV